MAGALKPSDNMESALIPHSTWQQRGPYTQQVKIKQTEEVIRGTLKTTNQPTHSWLNIKPPKGTTYRHLSWNVAKQENMKDNQRKTQKQTVSL